MAMSGIGHFIRLSLVSVAVRHYFNTRHNSQKFLWVLPAAVLSLLTMAYVTAPNIPGASENSSAAGLTEEPVRVSAEQVQGIVCHALRCLPLCNAFQCGFFCRTWRCDVGFDCTN